MTSGAGGCQGRFVGDTSKRDTAGGKRSPLSSALRFTKSLFEHMSKMKWWILKVNMKFKFESNYFLIHIFIVLFLSQSMLFK